MKSKRVVLLFSGDYRTFDNLHSKYLKIIANLEDRFQLRLVFVIKKEDILSLTNLKRKFLNAFYLDSPVKKRKSAFSDDVLYAFYSFASDIAFGLSFIEKNLSDYDLIVRLRYDLQINYNDINIAIQKAFDYNKNIFVKSMNFPEFNSYTDVFFVLQSRQELIKNLIKNLNSYRYYMKLYKEITDNNFHNFIPEVVLYNIVNEFDENYELFLNGRPALLRSNGVKIYTSETNTSKKNKLKYFLLSHIYTTHKKINSIYFSNEGSYETQMIKKLNKSNIKRKKIDRNFKTNRFKALIILLNADISLFDKFKILIRLT